MKSTYIIAELGNTHDGSLGIAKQMIRTAADCGADAVKIQTHIFDAESLPDAPNPPYFNDETRRQYFDRTSFSHDQYLELIETAEVECGVEFLSSPFSIEAIDFLERLKMRRYKIPSGEVSNIPLLERVALTNKPVILSSGMSSWSELDRAVDALRLNGCSDLTILQCTSSYPCPAKKVGLNLMEAFKKRYDVLVGYSDHTIGFAAPLSAVALGANVIEKHFTLSTSMYGSDAKNSMEPDEFKKMTFAIREIETMLYYPLDKDQMANDLGEMKGVFEKSIVAACDIPKGAALSMKHLAFKKPGTGISANEYRDVLGRKTTRKIDRNTMLNQKDII